MQLTRHLLITVTILFLTLITYAQQEDVFAIRNQYIVQLKGNVDGVKFLAQQPSVHIISCLSKNMNIWLVQSTAQNVLVTLKACEAVKVVQYNHGQVVLRALIPNDSLFNLQWNLHNTGTPSADISAPQAWQLNHNNLTQTGDSIVIAVIDGGLGAGFDIHHPDINFFVNHHEIPNNGIDDDGNGYIDDYYGWNVFGNNGNVYNTSETHSTHVSGIAAAKGNNNIGIAGVCWGAKVLAVNGAAEDEAHVVMAYDYVIEMRKLYNQTAGAKGAFIVSTNSSFGVGSYGANPDSFPIWCAMYDTLGSYGILSAVAVPDAAVNVDQVGDVPSGCPSNYLITVTSTTRTDGLNTQAAYGPTTVDIGAPGTGVMSCFPDSSYGYDNGTSMSSPHLAGAAAALFANACPALMQAYYARPDTIALLIRQYLFQSVDPLNSLLNITTTNGRLNLYHAMIAENSYNCNNCQYATTLNQQNLLCYGDSNATITTHAGSSAMAYRYLWSNGDTTATISGLKAGFYEVTVTDTAGCQRQLSTLIPQPQPIVVSSITTIPISTGVTGNIIVNAKAGNDNLTYAIDGGSFSSNNIFATNVTGLHHIYIRNQSGCVLDTLVGLYYLGVDNVKANPITVYPNPSAGSFNFTGLLLGCNLQVYDVLGEQIFSILTTGNTLTINLNNYSKGVYFYKVSLQGVFSGQGKLVVE